MGHQQYVGVRSARHCGCDATAARWQCVGLPQRTASRPEATRRAELGDRVAPSRPTEIGTLGKKQHRLTADKRFGQTANLFARAVAATEDIAVDHAELLEARWFTPAEVSERVANPRRRDSIGRYLMRSWLEDVSAGA